MRSLNLELPRTIQRAMGSASGLIEPSIICCALSQLPGNGIGSPVCRKCCSHTTPPLIRVQESHLFTLMFGREPRLPIDFLLGRVQDPVRGEVQDWVVEHQARLNVAFEGARERLLTAAGRRKERHDQRVREVPLSVGQLVYVRDLGVRGRHKIQDVWSPVVHQVLTAPAHQGAVYTVAPVQNLHQARTVHRDMLKAVLPESLAAPS